MGQAYPLASTISILLFCQIGNGDYCNNHKTNDYSDLAACGRTVSRRCQTEIVADSSTNDHAKYGHGSIGIAFAGENQLAQRATTQKDGPPTDQNHTKEVPYTVGMSYRLSGKTEIEALEDQIANHNGHKNSSEAGDEVEAGEEAIKAGRVELENQEVQCRDNLEKIKSGDLYRVAEVVKSLMLRDRIKSLSTGERKLLGMAKSILVSELVLATDGSVQDIERMVIKSIK